MFSTRLFYFITLDAISGFEVKFDSGGIGTFTTLRIEARYDACDAPVIEPPEDESTDEPTEETPILYESILTVSPGGGFEYVVDEPVSLMI